MHVFDGRMSVVVALEIGNYQDFSAAVLLSFGCS
jgi:hypothetical protein